MTDRIGWVVITYNQASHMPEIDPRTELYLGREDAEFALDVMRDETAEAGRRERHVLAEVVDLGEPVT
jgi:hypothetical protein